MSRRAPADDPSWWRLGTGGWKGVLASTAGQFKDDAVPILAAAVTLRIVLSLVPSLIAAVAIAARLVSPADIEALVASADEFIPQQSRGFVTDVLNDAVDELAQGAVQIVSVLVGLFAASTAATMLIKSLNLAYDVQEGRGFIRQRLASLAILGALGLALVGMFAALVLGPSILDWLLPQEILDSPLRYLITAGRYVAAITLLILFFGFVFWMGPNRERPRFHLLTPGAVFGVAGWVALSYGFSLYVSIAGRENFAVYGAAAGVFIMLIWLNLSFTVLLMGAELNNEIERHLAMTTTDPTVHARRPDPSAAGSDPRDGDPRDGDLDDGDLDDGDLDAVDPSMPRHPGLVTSRRDGGDARPPGRSRRSGTARPRLAGAAARTVGARVAALVWNRRGS